MKWYERLNQTAGGSNTTTSATNSSGQDTWYNKLNANVKNINTQPSQVQTPQIQTSAAPVVSQPSVFDRIKGAFSGMFSATQTDPVTQNVPTQRLQEQNVYNVNQQYMGDYGLEQAKDKTVWQKIGDSISNALNLGEENRTATDIASAQNAYSVLKNNKETLLNNRLSDISKETGISNEEARKYVEEQAKQSNKSVYDVVGLNLGELAKKGNNPLKNSLMEEVTKELGIRQDATTSELLETGFTVAIAAGLATAPVATLIGLGSFTAINEFKSGLISAIKGEGFKFGAGYTLSDAFNSTNQDVNTLLDVVDFLGTAKLSSGLMTSKSKISESLTKDIIKKYNLPSSVKVSPAEVKDVVIGRNTGYEKDILTSLKLSSSEWRKAAKQGVQIDVPGEYITYLVDKPYWAKLKSLIGKSATKTELSRETFGSKTTKTPVSGLLEKAPEVALNAKVPVEPKVEAKVAKPKVEVAPKVESKVTKQTETKIAPKAETKPSLEQGAKKYKTAEEFVKAQDISSIQKKQLLGSGKPILIHRGVNESGTNFYKGDGELPFSYYSLDKTKAGNYGKVSDYVFDSSGKTFRGSLFEKFGRDASIEDTNVISKLKSDGYDSAIIKGDELVVFDKNKVNQLTDIWSKANAKVEANPKVETSLETEAKKYKTAEEFVKAQTKFIHESSKKIDKFDLSKAGSGQGDNWYGQGAYLQQDGTFKIEKYGNVKNEFFLKPDTRVFDGDIIKYAESKGLRTGDSYSKVPRDVFDANITYTDTGVKNRVVEALKKDGYSAYNLDGELVVYDPSKLVNKSQLIDIWSKAQDKKPVLPIKKSDPLIEEAKKYKSAEEFVKEVMNESNIGQQGKLQEIPINKISGTDYPDLDSALKLGKKLSINEATDIVEPTDAYKVGQAVKYPIEVLANGDGTYSLSAGNHRLVQKLINGEDSIFASVQNVQGESTKSQLTSIWNKANKSKGTDLITEAKKYKSAEKFIEKNTPVEYSVYKIPKVGSSWETENIIRIDLFPNELVRGKGITKSTLLDVLKEQYSKGYNKVSPSLGIWTKDGSAFMDTLVRDGYLDKNYNILPQIKKWEYKSQLTEIWNKANAKVEAKPKAPKKTATKVKEPVKKVVSKPVAKVEKPKAKTDTKKSRFAERIAEQLLSSDPEVYGFVEDTATYDKIRLEEDAMKAVDFLEANTEKAVAVSLGIIEPPKGQTANSIAIAVSLKAKDEGNMALFAEVVNATSLRSTRAGQELVALRGHFGENSAQNFMKRVIDMRMNTLGGRIVSNAEIGGKKLSNKEKVVRRIDKQTKELKKKITMRQSKISSAQEIIDALRC